MGSVETTVCGLEWWRRTSTNLLGGPGGPGTDHWQLTEYGGGGGPVDIMVWCR